MYRTIFTVYGLSKLAEANATNTAIVLTHMAVGDGDGEEVTPSEEQTELVNEVYRDTLTSLYQDPNEPTQFIAEFRVPVEAGGFTVRELGLFDEDGGLVAVANTPEIYKPSEEDGALADSVFRMVFRVANPDNIELSIDPNVVVATKAYVDDQLANYYTKTETDGLLPDLSNYYTKTEIDSQFDGYYTKTETNSLIDGVAGDVDAALAGKVSKSGDTMSGKLGVVSVDAQVEALGNVSGSKSIDVSAASTFTMTITGNTTFSFTNPPGAGRDQVVYLKITNGGAYTITWPQDTMFAGGEAPTLTEDGTDLLALWYDEEEEAWVVGVVFADYQATE